MKISNEQRQEIISCMRDDLKMRQARDATYNQTMHSNYLKINVSSYSRIVNGDTDKVLKDVEWARIGKKLFVNLSPQKWVTAPTAVFNFVTSQLESCQRGHLTAINADMVGIGKTHAAANYAATHANVVYVKCREGLTRNVFVRLIAEGLGLANNDRIENIRERIALQLMGMESTLIILDDAGYMNDRCWMEVKSMYDENEFNCGWYIIGDTSLRKAIERLIENDKVGWVALFDRFNRVFQAISDMYDSEAEVVIMRRYSQEQVLKANMPGISKEEKKEILDIAGLSLRILRKEISKRQMI